MRGMHIKGHPCLAFGCPEKLSQEKKLSKRGGLEANVTLHKLSTDNIYEGNLWFGLTYTDHIPYASLWPANPGKNMF